jgi:hypothetical protein
MFLPRGRQLAAMGRDGRYAEDGGEERFSSLSPSAVAGYSPSFFHFKPAPAPTLLPTKHGAPPGGGGIYSSHLMGGKCCNVSTVSYNLHQIHSQYIVIVTSLAMLVISNVIFTFSQFCYDILMKFLYFNHYY